MNFKLVTAGYFGVVITAPTPEHADKIAVELIKKGYSITAGFQNGQIYMMPEDGAACIICFTIYTGTADITVQQIHKDLSDIIENCKVAIYSMIVSEYGPTMFGATNLLLPKKPQPPASPPSPPIPPETRKKMN